MKPISIYIVEDELLISASLKSQLQNFGYEILGSCTRGEICLEEVEALSEKGKEPEIILMDIHLRGEMDGIETAKRLGEKFHSAIIFLTGQSSKEVYERSFRIKPFGYLLKPIDMEQTKMTIEIAAYQRNLEIENRIYQKKLEDLLEKQTQEKSELLSLYKSIVDHSLIGLSIIQEEKFVFVNNRTAEIFGSRQEDFRNLDLRQFIGMLHHDDRISVINLYNAQQYGEQISRNIRLRIRRHDGVERHVVTYVRPLLYNGQAALHQSFIDITDYHLIN